MTQRLLLSIVDESYLSYDLAVCVTLDGSLMELVKELRSQLDDMRKSHPSVAEIRFFCPDIEVYTFDILQYPPTAYYKGVGELSAHYESVLLLDDVFRPIPEGDYKELQELILKLQTNHVFMCITIRGFYLELSLDQTTGLCRTGEVLWEEIEIE